MKSEPITLWIIRAGQTVWAADGRLRGVTDLPMSDAGRAGVQADVNNWNEGKPAIIHHPPDEAAMETAQLASVRCKAKVRTVADLADPNLGVLEGLTILEFEERFPSRHKQWEDDAISFAPPEGEDMIVAAQRVFKAVAKVLKKTRSQETAIVLHDIALGLMRCRLTGHPLNEWRTMLEDRPRVERYLLTSGMIQTLEQSPIVPEVSA